MTAQAYHGEDDERPTTIDFAPEPFAEDEIDGRAARVISKMIDAGCNADCVRALKRDWVTFAGRHECKRIRMSGAVFALSRFDSWANVPWAVREIARDEVRALCALLSARTLVVRDE